jgi:hypothetical protein
MGCYRSVSRKLLRFAARSGTLFIGYEDSGTKSNDFTVWRQKDKKSFKYVMRNTPNYFG